MKKKDSPSYKAMFEEVESIITSVQNSSLELDQMISEVKKGFSLIKKMRTRLDTTKNTIQELRMEADIESNQQDDDHSEDDDDENN
ncbi:MAG: exodeoxyribonuclease VII small subunit [Proteobacteria bacterium]|nr:exodeoxyribonuclease VII small subunit [Pseudomonadota bacterium]